MSTHAETAESMHEEVEHGKSENAVEEIFSGIKKITQGVWDAVKAVFYEGPKAIWNAFKSAFKGEKPAATHVKTTDSQHQPEHADTHTEGEKAHDAHSDDHAKDEHGDSHH